MGAVVVDLAGPGRVVAAAAVGEHELADVDGLERLRIDLPIAKTVFCCLSPHSTWTERLHCGKSAYSVKRFVGWMISSSRRSRTTRSPWTVAQR